MTRTLFTSAIALFTLAAVAPVSAAPVADGQSVSVRYADLNLDSTAGTKVLEQRIHAAIDRVCGQADPCDFAAAKDVAKCRSVALAGTRPLAALETKNQDFRIASR